MKISDLLNEDGRIVKGVNTTVDVGPDEIKKQAKKFGNSVDKDGRPPTLSKKVKGKSTNVLFNLGLAEGYKLQLERDKHIDVLHILDTKTKKRIEVRGKKGYERGNYDAQDKLHQVLDRVGKAANISELMNGEVVSINPNHPQGTDAEKTAKDVLQTEKVTKVDLDAPTPTIKMLARKYKVSPKKVLTQAKKGVKVEAEHTTDFEIALEIALDHINEDLYYYDKLEKVHEEALGEIASATEIYVDMDGVLADFFGEWARLMKVDHFTDINKQHDIDDALQKIRDTDDFWLRLPMLPEAKNLLNLIKDVKGEYYICTSPLADDPNSEKHKRTWVEKNLAFFPPKEVYVTHDKPQYAKHEDGTPNILIDDYGVNIRNWESAGGYGFKYKDHKFERTAKAIKQHMQEPVEENVNEAFDNPYPIDWNLEGKDQWYGTAKDDEFRIQIKEFSPGFWSILFRVGGSLEKTGAGDQFRIFATAKQGIQEWWNWASKNIDVEGIMFSADKILDDSRATLYDRLAKQFASSIGYKLEVSKGSKADIYNLKKPDLEENFANINEALDNPYPFSLQGPDPSHAFAATAETPNGILRMDFKDDNYDEFSIDFVVGKSMDKTDAGDEFRVFATVVAMMIKWINTVGIEHVESFDFTADKVEHASDGRARLYARFAKQLASRLGWKLEQSTTGNGSTAFFRLTNPKPVPRDDDHFDNLEDNPQLEENFADGKKKGKSRPGRVKKSGASCNGSVTSLRKRAKNASGEKAKMYHWCANMKSGKKK